MTRISNTNQIVLLLKAELDRKARINKSKKKPASSSTSQIQTDRPEMVRPLKDYPEGERNHALVISILSRQFGDGIINDPGFQNIVLEIVTALTDDENTKSLLNEVIGSLSIDHP